MVPGTVSPYSSDSSLVTDTCLVAEVYLLTTSQILRMAIYSMVSQQPGAIVVGSISLELGRALVNCLVVQSESLWTATDQIPSLRWNERRLKIRLDARSAKHFEVVQMQRA